TEGATHAVLAAATPHRAGRTEEARAFAGDRRIVRGRGGHGHAAAVRERLRGREAEPDAERVESALAVRQAARLEARIGSRAFGEVARGRRRRRQAEANAERVGAALVVRLAASGLTALTLRTALRIARLEARGETEPHTEQVDAAQAAQPTARTQPAR